jgi:hypothetical protein
MSDLKIFDEKTLLMQLHQSVEDHNLRTWSLSADAACTIERLIRERDEARAEAFSLAANQCLHGLHGDAHGNPYCPGITEAEARGFERGIREAAKMLTIRAKEISENLLPVSAVNELHGYADAILALLEPTLQEQSK